MPRIAREGERFEGWLADGGIESLFRPNPAANIPEGDYHGT